ncbi:hypothetical protein BDW67DRAFT_44974 [Aspergillus spinulosporus]
MMRAAFLFWFQRPRTSRTILIPSRLGNGLDTERHSWGCFVAMFSEPGSQVFEGRLFKRLPAGRHRRAKTSTGHSFSRRDVPVDSRTSSWCDSQVPHRKVMTRDVHFPNLVVSELLIWMGPSIVEKRVGLRRHVPGSVARAPIKPCGREFVTWEA